MYLRAAKTEAEDAGISTEGMADSVSQLRDELMALTGNKVDIMSDAEAGKYKSTVEILRELSLVWNDLSDTSRTNITELIGGGVRNANIISALMENFDIVDEAIAVSMESSGSALAENEKYLDSIVGKTAQFRAEFENLSSTFFSSDVIKGFVDAGTSLLSGLNSVSKSFGPILLALAGGRVLDTITNLSRVFKESTKLKILKSVFEAFRGGALIEPFKDLPVLFKTLFSDIKGGVPVIVALKNAFANLGATSVLLVIGAAIAAFQALKRAKEDAIQDAQAASDAYNDEKASLEDYKEQVESLNEKINDKNSTPEEVYEAKKHLHDIQMELAKLYGSDKIIDVGLGKLTEDANLAAEAFEQLAVDRAEAFIAGNSKGINTAISEMNKVREYTIGNFNWDEMSADAQNAISKIVEMNDNLQLTPTYVEGLGNVMQLTVKGTAEEIQGALTMYKTAIDGMEIPMKNAIIFLGGVVGELTLDQSISKIIGNVGGVIDNYGNTAAAGIDAYIKKTPEFKSAVQQMTDAQNAFVDATMGSHDSTEDQIDALNKAIDTSKQAVSFFDSINWSEIKGVTPEIAEVIRSALSGQKDILQSQSKQLNLELKVATSVDEGKLKDDANSTVKIIQEHLEAFMDDSGEVWSADILSKWLNKDSFDSDGIIDEQEKACLRLDAIFSQFGYTMQTGLAMLREYGLVIGTTAQQLGDASRAFSLFASETNAINNAIKSQQNGNSITLEQYEALIDINSEYAKCLERNAGVLRFNTDAVREISDAKNKERTEIIATNKAYAQFKYSEIANELRSLTDTLEEYKIEGRDDVSTIEDQIKALETEGAAILDTINKYDLMAAAIREATSARSDWLNSKDDQQPGDSFTDAADAYAHLWEVLNGSTATRGDTGTSMYKSALDYLIPDDDEIRKSEATIRQYMRNLQSILKIDGKGNISDIKINEILRRLTQGEDAIFDKDKDGNYLAKEGKTLDDFAKKLGITRDLARDIIGMLNRNGMNIDIEDDDMESFIEKAEDAKNAIDTLYNTDGNKDFNIRINFDGIDDPEEKIKAINDSLEKASALTIKYDVGTKEWKAAADIIDHLVEQKKMVQYDDILAFDTEKIEGQAKTALDTVKQFINAQADLEKAEKTYGKDSQQYKDAEEGLRNAIDAIKKNITDENILSALKLNVADLFSSEDLSTVTANIQNALQSVDATTLASELGIAKDAIMGIGSTADTLEDKDVTIGVTIDGMDQLVAALAAYNQLIDKEVTVTVNDGEEKESPFKLTEGSSILSDSLNSTKQVISDLVAQFEKLENKEVSVDISITGADTITDFIKKCDELIEKSIDIAISLSGHDLLSDAVDDFNTLESKDVSLTISTDSNETDIVKQTIQEIKDAIAQADGLVLKYGVDNTDGEAALDIINQLIDCKTQLEYNAILSIDASALEEDVANAVELLQQFVIAKANLDRACAGKIYFGGFSGIEDAQAQIDSLVESISKIDQDILDNFEINADNLNIDSISEALQSLTLEDLQLNLNIDSSALTNAISNYNQLKNKSVKVTISVIGTEGLISALAYYNSLQDKTVTITIITVRKTINGNGNGGDGAADGTASVSGTAHFIGTAKVSGDWGTAKPGRTLVGELGREIVVDPHTGMWYTVGDTGAEFVDMPGGAIVFNHLQTRHLLENGHVTSRGKAMASGTAAASLITGGGRPSDSATSSGSGGSYGGSGSGKNYGRDGTKSWFEQEYDSWNHLLNMEQARLKEYLEWLDKAYQNAYDTGIIKIEDFYKYQEEVYEKQKELFEDTLTDAEHQIEGLLRSDGNEEQVINIYYDMIKSLEARIEEAKAYGLNENDEYIQELTEKIYDYQDEIDGIREDSVDAAKNAVKDLVDYRIKMLKKDLDNEKDALKDKKTELKDFYSKQKEMLQDVYDEEKYLEEQSEKREAKKDIEIELKRLEFDDSAWAQKRKQELQEELAKADKDLLDFEKDHNLDKTKELLDDLYDRQEKQIESEIEALDERLNDPKALYNQALADIQNNTLALYEEMVEYNDKYGSGNSEETKEMWEDAKESLDKYLSTFGEAYKNIILTPLPDGYATGTINATPGLHSVDELGPEYVFTSSNGARYRVFSGGEKVLNAKATNFLYNFANSGEKILSTIFEKIVGSHMVSQVSPFNQVSEINMGDVIIQGNANEATVSEIRRAKREEMQWILKEFNKMNKRS